MSTFLGEIITNKVILTFFSTMPSEIVERLIRVSTNYKMNSTSMASVFKLILRNSSPRYSFSFNFQMLYFLKNCYQNLIKDEYPHLFVPPIF